METGPHNILGLEINEFAAELARVTVWIGDIQWCRRNGYPHAINPILKPLDGIEHRDALLNPDGSEADWPTADVIVGNPPFLGGRGNARRTRPRLFRALRKPRFDGRVPGGADLVSYWFHKARKQIVAGKLQAAGLVSTQLFGLAPIARCWKPSSPTRGFSRRGATKNGSMTAPPCAFRFWDLGRFSRLTVAVGWMALEVTVDSCRLNRRGRS